MDEAAVTPIPSTWFDLWIERFLKDDGTICLGLIGLIVLLHNRFMSLKSQDSSSGLSSTSNNSANSSGLSSMGSDDDETATNAVTKASGVPLSRMLVWVALVSVLGFLLGQHSSVHLVGDAATNPASDSTKLDQDGTSSTDAAAASPKNESTRLLERYIQELEEKKVTLPTFAEDDGLAAKMALERRKEFAEFIVHPVLLISGAEDSPNEESNTIAIAVNTDDECRSESFNQPRKHACGIDLANDLVKEVLLYDDMEVITMLLVSSEAASKEGCPPDLVTVENPKVTLTCLHIDPSWAPGSEPLKKVLPDDGFEVAIVLSGCNAKSTEDRLWEKTLFENVHSQINVCIAPRRPRGIPLTAQGLETQHRRLETMDDLLMDDDETIQDRFPSIVDYDVQGVSMALAFHEIMSGPYRWKLNEANHNEELRWRLKDRRDEERDIRYFEAPDMTRLSFPTLHSAVSHCNYRWDYPESISHDDEANCKGGYDPYSPNVPIDKIYVDRSVSGDYVGRGVFTSIDILEEGTYVGLETSVQSVFYPPLSKTIVDYIALIKVYNSFDDETIMDITVDDDDDVEDYDGGARELFKTVGDVKVWVAGVSGLMSTAIHRAPTTYAEAYGFDEEPWGVLQTSVYSNILTFTNHGCNGTANIGYNIPGVNEFTIDLENPDFTIPKEIRIATSKQYAPSRDRAYPSVLSTSRVEHAPILKGQELYDNYMSFAGDEGFKQMIRDLRRDCSGGIGVVEQLQLQKIQTEKPASADGSSGSQRSSRRTARDTTDPAPAGGSGSDEL